jgi:hypothetical protein
LRWSKPTSLAEGKTVAAGDDEMVDHLHVDQAQRGFELVGEPAVGLRRLGNAGRVVVRRMCPGLFCAGVGLVP